MIGLGSDKKGSIHLLDADPGACNCNDPEKENLPKAEAKSKGDTIAAIN